MKTLAKSVSAKHLVDEVMMKLNKPENRKKVVVWVEGTDWRVYRKFFDRDKIVEAGGSGCQQNIDGHHQLQALVPSQLSIVINDADFGRIEGEDLDADPNIFYTDGHDVEMMMMSRENVRRDLGDVFEIDGDNEKFFDDVFNDLYPLSFFKWYDCHFKRAYSYEQLSKVQQSSEDLRSLDWIEEKLHDCSKSKWNNSNHNTPFEAIDPEDVKQFIQANSSVDKYELTNGHDYYNRVCFYLKTKFGYTRDENQLKDSVIISFNYKEFKQTNLHRALRCWCDANVDIFRKAI